MFAVSLTGTLSSGPSRAGCDDSPALANILLALTSANKTANVRATSMMNLNSSASFVDLGGVGTNKPVTKATLLVVKTKAPMVLRITTDDGSGGSSVATQPISGIFIAEYDATKPVKLLEAQGVGVLEYAAFGAL